MNGEQRPVLTEEQETAATLAIHAVTTSEQPVFTLHGLAGTGKTTVLAEIARRLPGSMLTTLTGKAASVLAAKTKLPVRNLHAIFYKLREKTTDEKGNTDLIFDPLMEGQSMRRRVVLLDECSMINDTIAGDILNTGARIIACGDPGQLPPVKGSPFFKDADFTLEQIHRQAQESSIIRQAHRVRAGREYRPDGQDFQVLPASRVDSDLLLSADVVLCWRNRTRQALNRRLRAERGLSPEAWPCHGEPVICLRNAPQYGLYNGAVYELAADYEPGSGIRLLIADRERHVPCAAFLGLDAEEDDDFGIDSEYGYEPTIFFDYGYAMTVHKAQGSEWPHVMLLDEYYWPRPDSQRPRWLYTGITRAAQRATIIRV